MTTDELIIDSFAGGGGASLGIAWATGRAPDVAIDHDADALAMHAANHPATLHVAEDVWRADLQRLTGGRPVGLLWASPDCRHFSRAKGGRPVKNNIRGLAWVVCKWARAIRPRVIVLENVSEFEQWGPIVPAWRCRACDWRGTEGQAVLARVRRRCPRCNSLRLGASEDLIADPERKGLTFRRWVARLRNLGYVVAWRTRNAADYGAPTHRRRLFVVARRDGEPIVWPEPTHAAADKLDAMPPFGRPKPYRTAAEIIDWSLPCPSIFDRPRPLAEKTLRRIAIGLRRYVLENPSPYIVHGQPLDRPLGTVTGHHGYGLYLAKYHAAKGGEDRCRPVDEPINTLDTQNRFAMVAAMLTKFYGREVGHGLDRPIGTVTTIDHHGLVYAFLVKYFGTAIGQAVERPLGTQTGKHRFGVVQVEVEPGQHEPAVAVEVAGVGPCVIADIGLRMLTPRELARAQGFPDTYELTGTKSNQVARIGNSVPPALAQAMVAANYLAAEAVA